MIIEHIKKVKGKKKAYCVYIPESYLKHLGWEEGETIALYPNDNKIEIVSMDPKKYQKKSKNEDESFCSYCC